MNSTVSVEKLLEDIAIDWLMRLPSGNYESKDMESISILRESLRNVVGDKPEFINEFIKNFVDANQAEPPSETTETLNELSAAPMEALDATKTEQFLVNMINFLSDDNISSRVAHGQISNDEIFQMLSHSIIVTGKPTDGDRKHLLTPKIAKLIEHSKIDYMQVDQELIEAFKSTMKLAHVKKGLSKSNIKETDWKPRLYSALQNIGLDNRNPAHEQVIDNLFDIVSRYKDAESIYKRACNSVEFSAFVRKINGQFQVAAKVGEEEDEVDEGIIYEASASTPKTIDFLKILTKLRKNLVENKLIGAKATSSGQGSFNTSKYWADLTSKRADVPKSDILLSDTGVSVKYSTYQLVSGYPAETQATVFSVLDRLGRDTIINVSNEALVSLEKDFEFLTQHATNIKTSNVSISNDVASYIKMLNTKLKEITFISNSAMFKDPTFFDTYSKFREIINALTNTSNGLSDKPIHGDGNVIVANSENIKYALTNLPKILEKLSTYTELYLSKTDKQGNPIKIGNVSMSNNIIHIEFHIEKRNGISKAKIGIDLDKLNELIYQIGSKELPDEDKTERLFSNYDVAKLFHELDGRQKRMIEILNRLIANQHFAMEFTKECASGQKKFDPTDGGDQKGAASSVLIWNDSFNTKISMILGDQGDETIRKLVKSLKIGFSPKSNSIKRTPDGRKMKVGYTVTSVLRGAIADTEFASQKLSEVLNEEVEHDFEIPDGEMEFNPNSINNLFGTFHNKVKEAIKECADPNNLDESVGDFISKNMAALKAKFFTLINWLKAKFYELSEYIKKSVANALEVFDIEVGHVEFSTNPMGVLLDD